MNRLLELDPSPSALIRAKASIDTRRSAAPTTLRWLLLILSIALTGRLALLPWFSTVKPATVDERHFNELALNVVRHHEFSFTVGRPTSMRPPLYSAFVAGVYAIAGPENFQAVRLTQIVLNLLTVVAVFLLARELYGNRVGLAAAAVLATYPSLWGHCYLLLTEVLFTFLLTFGLWCGVRFLRHDRLIELALCAVLLGLAGLTRSAVALVPPLVVFVLLCARRLSWGRRLAASAVFVAAFGATLAPWIVRNSQLHRTLAFVDTSSGRIVKWAFGLTPPERLGQKPAAKGPKSSEAQMDVRALQETVAHVAGRPGQVVTHAFENFLNLWGLERELVAGMAYGNFGRVPKGSIIVAAGLICGSYVVILFCGIFGAALFPPRDRLAGLLLLLVVAHVTAVHSLVYGHSRYHIGVMPIVAVCAGAFLANLRPAWAMRGRPRFWLAGAACFVFATAWSAQVYREHSVALLQKFANR